MCHSPFKMICTKFAPKQKTRHKQNPENRDGFGVFEYIEIIQIISLRTVAALRKQSGGLFLACDRQGAMPPEDTSVGYKKAPKVNLSRHFV